MNKIIYKNKIIILSIVISATIYFTNRNPEYIWIDSETQLSDIKMKVYEIEINRINDTSFNTFKRNSFCGSGIYGRVIPITKPERIEQFINLIINSDYSEEVPAEVLFLKTKKNIYCMSIDWDDEKVYGRNWQSKELYELIKQWRQEKEDLYYQARENWEHQSKAIEEN